MAAVIATSRAPLHVLSRAHPSSFTGAHGLLLRHRRRPIAAPFPPQASLWRPACKLGNCDALEADDASYFASSPCCSTPLVHIAPDVLSAESVDVVGHDAKDDLPFAIFPEEDDLEATPAYPAGLYALYASSFAGNLVEQLWNFAWPAAVANLHPSLLPVSVIGFFAKLTIFVWSPLVGNLMDCVPRIPAYNSLNCVQTAMQLLSALMIIHAINTFGGALGSAVIFQPWFMVLVVAGAIERVAGLALGVTMEREWVVLLAGTNRPVALAKANAIVSRIDLLCEMAGASLFGFLLSKYDPVTCLKFTCCMMMCTLPVLIILGHIINEVSGGALDSSRSLQRCGDASRSEILLNPAKIFQNGFHSIRNGWLEYKQLPVLPASVAYVLLFFNIALAPGATLTTFLTHLGVNPSIIGGFSGMCAFMGVFATFISSFLVKNLGTLKAGAAGLLFQALLLVTAVATYLGSLASRGVPLYTFLFLIALSRLGHMSYDVIGTQILQTGISADKANLIGTTEIAISGLAELVMLGVAMVANKPSHFGFLVMLSVLSVLAAAFIFCRWISSEPPEFNSPERRHRRSRIPFSLDSCQWSEVS